jgi:hypothetical protein
MGLVTRYVTPSSGELVAADQRVDVAGVQERHLVHVDDEFGWLVGRSGGDCFGGRPPSVLLPIVTPEPAGAR